MDRKVYPVIKVRKPTGSMVNGLRVIRCDCGRAVTVNAKCEVQSHDVHSSGRGGRCPMSWKRVEIAGEAELNT